MSPVSPLIQLLRYERKLILGHPEFRKILISPVNQGRTTYNIDVDNNKRDISFWGKSKGDGGWKKALSDAEKIVGSPGSFMSLRCLLSEELSNIAVQMRKLVGTGHPLLQIARKFIFDGNHSMQMRGLLVLLISKAAGQSTANMTDQQMVSGIYPRQRIIAEITEMIHTAKLIHCGVVEMTNTDSIQDSNDHNMVFGNKIAVLSGDFLLANVSSSLADVKNAKVVELMSSAITDITEAEFTSISTTDDSPLIAWQRRAFLASGSLIAKSLKAAMLLVDHTDEVQRQTFEFGKQIGQALQISDELQGYTADRYLDAYSLPIALECERIGSLRPLHIAQYGNDQEQRQLYNSISTSKSLKEARHLGKEYSLKALNYLDFLPRTSEAAGALRNVSKHMVHI